MEPARNVIADPLPIGPHNTRPSCFACLTSDSRKPARKVILDKDQVRLRASVDTGNIQNPFLKLDGSSSQEVWLCTACRDKQRGWNVICNPRKYGQRNSQKALRAWRTRCSRLSTKKSERPKPCCICSSLSRSTSADVNITPEETSTEKPKRNPTTDWTIYRLVGDDEDFLKAEFTAEFCRLANCDVETVESLLKDPSKVKLCYVHLNHSRCSQQAAKRKLKLRDES